MQKMLDINHDAVRSHEIEIKKKEKIIQRLQRAAALSELPGAAALYRRFSNVSSPALIRTKNANFKVSPKKLGASRLRAMKMFFVQFLKRVPGYLHS